VSNLGISTEELDSASRTFTIGRGGDAEMEGGGDQDRNNGDQEQRRIQLSGSSFDGLLGESDTTSKETPDIVSYIYLCLPRNSLHAKNQEDVTQDRSDKGRLDDRQFALDQSQDSDDKFDHIPKGGVEQSTKCLTESKGSFFCGESK